MLQSKIQFEAMRDLYTLILFWYNPVRLTGPTRGQPCRCGDLLKIDRKE